MRKQITNESTPTQLMLGAKGKLLGVHKGLTNYGESARMDMKQVERLEIAMLHLEKAIQALSASSDLHAVEREQLPF